METVKPMVCPYYWDYCEDKNCQRGCICYTKIKGYAITLIPYINEETIGE